MNIIQRRQSGFTIVELLIVIVVIGILAAITIVAYNGIQERSSQARTVSALSQYAKAVSAYAVDNSEYPQASGCLGWDSDLQVKCLNKTLTNGAACFGLGAGNSSSTLSSALTPYLGSNVPTVSEKEYSCGGTKYSGAYYYIAGSGIAYLYSFIASSTSTCPGIGGLTLNSTSTNGGARLCQYRLPAL